jgi:hypothetical protein
MGAPCGLVEARLELLGADVPRGAAPSLRWLNHLANPRRKVHKPHFVDSREALRSLSHPMTCRSLFTACPIDAGDLTKLPPQHLALVLRGRGEPLCAALAPPLRHRIQQLQQEARLTMGMEVLRAQKVRLAGRALSGPWKGPAPSIGVAATMVQIMLASGPKICGFRHPRGHTL